MKLQSLLHTYAMNCNFLCETTHTLLYSESCIWILKIIHKAIEIGTPHSNFDLIVHGEL
jgi:hypothetical protein